MIGYCNLQVVVVDLQSGVVYVYEYGLQGGDEINCLVEGCNYGWLIIFYGIDYIGVLVIFFEIYLGMIDLLVYWMFLLVLVGMVFYFGEMFFEWCGDLFVVVLILGEVLIVSGYICWVDLEDGQIVDQMVLLSVFEVCFCDICMVLDGSLLVIIDSDNGQLICIYCDQLKMFVFFSM